MAVTADRGESSR